MIMIMVIVMIVMTNDNEIDLIQIMNKHYLIKNVEKIFDPKGVLWSTESYL